MNDGRTGRDRRSGSAGSGRPRPAPRAEKHPGAEQRRPGGRSAGPVTAVGPLRKAIGTDGTTVKGPSDVFGDAANALILMRRAAFVDGAGSIDKTGARALLRWAVDTRLGQEPGLLRAVLARRSAALAALRARGHAVVRLRARPEWRLAVGLGERANPHEIGLALHGSYGWPVIPGSSVKGLTAAWAEGLVRSQAVDPSRLDAVFGTPRPERREGAPGPERQARRGSVCFLDAIPAGAPVTVAVDVVTPHAQPYYRAMEGCGEPVPPAEYHNPIPSPFLVISGGEFAVDLVGPADDADTAAGWCAEAFDQLGVGGKTGAGYGYATARRTGEGA